MRSKLLTSALVMMFCSPAFCSYGHVWKCQISKGGVLVYRQAITSMGSDEDITVGYYPQGEASAAATNVSGSYKLISVENSGLLLTYHSSDPSKNVTLKNTIGRSDLIYEFDLADGTVETLQCLSDL